MHTQAFTSVIHQLKENKVSVNAIKNGLSATVAAKSKGDLFFTIPYDKGWSAKVDGKVVPVKQAQTGFMTVPLSEGSHTVQLRFIPQGLKIGIVCFLSAIGIFRLCQLCGGKTLK